MSSDFYAALGILPDAEDVVIKAAYRALAQRYHPDKWRGDPAEANRRMIELNNAYAVLGDKSLRAKYDETRTQSPDPEPKAEAQRQQGEAFTAQDAAPKKSAADAQPPPNSAKSTGAPTINADSSPASSANAALWFVSIVALVLLVFGFLQRGPTTTSSPNSPPPIVAPATTKAEPLYRLAKTLTIEKNSKIEILRRSSSEIGIPKFELRINGATNFSEDVDILEYWKRARISKGHVFIFEGYSGNAGYPTIIVIRVPNSGPASRQRADLDPSAKLGKVSTNGDTVAIDLGWYEGLRRSVKFDGQTVEMVNSAAPTEVSAISDSDCTEAFKNAYPECQSPYLASCLPPFDFSNAGNGGLRHISNHPSYNKPGFDQLCAAACSTKSSVNYLEFKKTVCRL